MLRQDGNVYLRKREIMHRIDYRGAMVGEIYICERLGSLVTFILSIV